jgi:hypothetical protein
MPRILLKLRVSALEATNVENAFTDMYRTISKKKLVANDESTSSGN